MIATRRLLVDRLRSFQWWSLGAAGLVLSTTALYPSIKGNQSFEKLAEELPPAVVSFFGIDTTIGMTSAPGYLHARLFSTLLPVVLLIFGIGLGTRALAGAEDEGMLELTLSHPLTRRRLASERYVAVVVLLVALTGVVTVVLFGSAAAAGALVGVSRPGLLVACAGAGALALLHATIAFGVGAATGRRSLATGFASTAAVAGYLIHGLLGITEVLEPLRYATPWHWYLERNMLATGPTAMSVVAPIFVSALVVVAGLWAFERRDLR